MIESVILSGLESRLSVTRDIEEELVYNIKKESNSRTAKRLGIACPYQAVSGLCMEKGIRCGERQMYPQSSDPATRAMIRNFPHRCNYNPLGDKHFAVVHANDTMRGYFSLLLEECGIGRKFIDSAFSYDSFEKLLSRGKIENKQYAMVISGIWLSNVGFELPNKTGYQLANLLVERNYNARIILVEEVGVLPPANYMGNEEIVPRQRVVSRLVKNSEFSLSLIEEELDDIGMSTRQNHGLLHGKN